jgi:predicted dienelactone hydrolase
MKRTLSITLALSLLILSGCSLLTGADDYPLAEAGPYHVGIRKMIGYEDASRGGRQIYLTIWYPTQSQEAIGILPLVNAPPDLTTAPYPLILSSAKVGFIFAPHLASHGFVVAGVNSQDSKDAWGDWLIDYPLDLRFALGQLASNPPAGFETLIDTANAGAMGYSFDGYTALALSGARIDPEYYLAQCAAASGMDSTLPGWWVEYICAMAGGWQAFAGHAGQAITSSDDGLWQTLTDDRIRAVMPMAPEGAWLFGERGLAAVDRPVLIIGATADTINLYDQEASFIFDQLGTPDKVLISFLDQGHMIVYDPEMISRMQHFAVAFFGYHLQGKTEYLEFFSRKFVLRHDGLVWGVYR